jgi:hypothetical protein
MDGDIVIVADVDLLVGLSTVYAIVEGGGDNDVIGIVSLLCSGGGLTIIFTTLTLA